MTRRFFVTTPIYCVNDVPHIGHAYTMVAADVLARWHRMLGHDVLFLTGTDPHGPQRPLALEQQGAEQVTGAATTAERFRETWKALDISSDDFLATTEPRHDRAVSEFLKRVYDSGDIELDTYEGPYCVACEARYADHELINGACPIHELPVEKVVEQSYVFRLSRYEQRLLDHYAAHPEALQTESSRDEVIGFIRGGLRDVSVSRGSLNRGAPLPWDPSHVACVWLDALISYCSAAGLGTDRERFAQWWPVDCHIVGKELLRSHAVYWPAMLLAAGLEPPKFVFEHGCWLEGGAKLSQTRLHQISPADLVAEFGVDGFRYQLLTGRRFGHDSEFSRAAMVERYNADLADTYGNLAHRVLNMAVNYCGASVPAVRADGTLVSAAEQAWKGAAASMDRLDFSGALGQTWELMRATNVYIDQTKPWKLSKQGDAVAGVLGDCLEALRIATVLAAPTIPNATAEVWQRLGLVGSPLDQRLPDAVQWGLLPAGNPLVSGARLFPRCDPNAASDS